MRCLLILNSGISWKVYESSAKNMGSIAQSGIFNMLIGEFEITGISIREPGKKSLNPQ